jgi:hypothetical protein
MYSTVAAFTYEFLSLAIYVLLQRMTRRKKAICVLLEDESIYSVCFSFCNVRTNQIKAVMREQGKERKRQRQIERKKEKVR